MDYTFNIDLSQGPFYYKLFYTAAFVLAYGVILFYLIRNKKVNGTYLTTTSIIFFAFVVGCKLIFVADKLISDPSALSFQTGGQMALGGVILSFFAVHLLQVLLRLDTRYLDILGYSLIAGITLQKIGCFMAGCCFGFPGNGPLCVSYTGSIPYHALQLYEMMAFATMLALLPFLKKLIQRPGSIYYATIVFFAFIQFVAEYFKSTEASLAFAGLVHGLKLSQWIYASLILLATLCLFLNENSRPVISQGAHGIFWKLMFLLAAITFLFFLSRHLLYDIEVLALNIAFLPALIYSVLMGYQYITLPRYRLAMAIMCVLPIFLMSQTLVPTDTTEVIYKSFMLGYKSGNSRNTTVNDPSPSSCNDIDSRDFEHAYSLVGFGYNVTNIRPNRTTNFGIDGFIGSHEESSTDPQQLEKFDLIGLSPYYFYEGNRAAIGVGLHIGNFSNEALKNRHRRTGMPKTGTSENVVLPRLHFRYGWKKILFAEYNFANTFLSPFPEQMHDFAMGSGFGLENGFYLKFGITSAGMASNYVAGYIPVNKSFAFVPLYRFGSGNTYSLSLQYRFGHQSKPYSPGN